MPNWMITASNGCRPNVKYSDLFKMHANSLNNVQGQVVSLNAYNYATAPSPKVGGLTRCS